MDMEGQGEAKSPKENELAVLLAVIGRERTGLCSTRDSVKRIAAAVEPEA
jgi:hypothetical protein